MDKAGSYIGWLYPSHNSPPFAVDLVKSGFASVHASAEKSPHFAALEQAQVAAKEKKLNVSCFGGWSAIWPQLFSDPTKTQHPLPVAVARLRRARSERKRRQRDRRGAS